LQTNYQIYIKSFNACNSYRGLSEVTPKTKVSTVGNRTDIWLSKCTSVQIWNITKVCVQNALRVLECKQEHVDAIAWSLHRWTPGGNVPTLRSGVTSAGERHESGCDTHAPELPPNLACSGKFCDEFFAPCPFSCLSTLIKTRSSAGNTMFIVYANVDCINTTSLPDKWLQYKQRCIGNRDILSSVFED